MKCTLVTVFLKQIDLQSVNGDTCVDSLLLNNNMEVVFFGQNSNNNYSSVAVTTTTEPAVAANKDPISIRFPNKFSSCKILQRKLELKVERAKKNYSHQNASDIMNVRIIVTYFHLFNAMS